MVISGKLGIKCFCACGAGDSGTYAYFRRWGGGRPVWVFAVRVPCQARRGAKRGGAYVASMCLNGDKIARVGDIDPFDQGGLGFHAKMAALPYPSHDAGGFGVGM